MPKNIVIFSDGTGQRGGIFVDERRSNIYKLFRATRCGPDSSVDPSSQVTFYNPGIGTLPGGLGAIGTLWRRLYNLVSQALGLGLTTNIIDCYAAIIRYWRPGDRIFLFGFSRGAYTIRCLGGVIALCGIPTSVKGGGPFRRDPKAAKGMAKEAVRRVYLHTNSRKDDQATPRQKQLLQQRRFLAELFREKYGSGSKTGANTYPYFIGVFDTVASLSDRNALIMLFGFGAIGIGVISGLLWLFSPPFWVLNAWWQWFVALAALAGAVAYLANIGTRIKGEIGLTPRDWWRVFHLAEPRMKFYDTELNKNVGYARHAISIDENRSSFQRVPWGTPTEWRNTGEGNPTWFQQIWFAGDHADIGGGYAEEESRLSDIAAKWMVEAAASVGMKHDPSLLHLYPDPTGPQHDEMKSSIFKYAGKALREVQHDAPLHASVLERFEASQVLQYDVLEPYRPECLREHDKVKHFYG